MDPVLDLILGAEINLDRYLSPRYKNNNPICNLHVSSHFSRRDFTLHQQMNPFFKDGIIIKFKVKKK